MLEQIISFLTLADYNTRFVVGASLLLGIASAVAGCFAFLRKRALTGDAVAHSVLPGICLAFIFTGVRHPAVLFTGAVVTGWLSLIIIDWIAGKSKLKTDTAIALVLSVFFSVGILLLTSIQHSGAATQAGLDRFLFGKAASMVREDFITIAVVTAIIITCIIIFYKPFKLLSFDPDFARATGLPMRFYQVMLSAITVLAIVTGIQAVGVVLMAALLVTPAAAARYWTDKLWLMLVIAAAFGAFAAYAGGFISYLAPAMPTGPWTVMFISLIAFASIIFSPHRGWLSKHFSRQRNKLKILEENILKMLYQLGEASDDFFQPKTIEDLLLKRSLPVADLKLGLRKLSKKGFVERVNSGWQLTDVGQHYGKRVVRLHRLWELYLTSHLQIAPDHVHDDAEAIEHVITPELEQRLEHLLGNPLTDPHNSKIPTQ